MLCSGVENAIAQKPQVQTVWGVEYLAWSWQGEESKETKRIGYMKRDDGTFLGGKQMWNSIEFRGGSAVCTDDTETKTIGLEEHIF
jgi:hypothetical protein